MTLIPAMPPPTNTRCGLQMHSCLMLTIAIMRSFLPAQHLWYVKAGRLTNWQQHLNCTRFTFWKLKGKRGRERATERVGGEEEEQDGGVAQVEGNKSVWPPQRDMDEVVNYRGAWHKLHPHSDPLMGDRQCHWHIHGKKIWRAIKSLWQHRRGTPSECLKRLRWDLA